MTSVMLVVTWHKMANGHSQHGSPPRAANSTSRPTT